MIEDILPIQSLDDPNWVDKLSTFLNEHDVDVIGISCTDGRLPRKMRDYMNAFGGTDSHDFMYNLKRPNDFVLLQDSDWDFTRTEFIPEETEGFLVISESSGNDPICLRIDTGEIYLFSHDPNTKSKVFVNFDDYVIHEVLTCMQLVSDSPPTDEEIHTYARLALAGSDIDFEHREMSM